MIDTERLRAHLETTASSLRESIKDSDPDEPGTNRIAGAVLMMERLLRELGQFEVQTGRRTSLTAMALDTPVKNRIRAYGQETSLEAAIAQTPAKSFTYYRLIHRALTLWGPLTDEELDTRLRAHYEEREQEINFTVSGLRARRSELVKAGWVKNSGTKRNSVAGHPMIVWEAVA